MAFYATRAADVVEGVLHKLEGKPRLIASLAKTPARVPDSDSPWVRADLPSAGPMPDENASCLD